jgi:murein DD-endopeptidase MepM/ murein hydrolase activator NlpD
LIAYTSFSQTVGPPRMSRRLVLPLFALVVAHRGAAAGPPPDENHTVIDHAIDGIASGLATLTDWLTAPDRTASLVRLQVDLRDLGRAAEDWMVAGGGGIAQPVPTLTALSASPVPDVESSGFGWRDDPVHHNRKFHKGTDFRADRGTAVHAAGDGVVAFTGWQHGYGRLIIVDHGGGVITRYAHLAKIEVATGAPVIAAARIGQVGASGKATGPHLHFEIRLDGRAVDPVLAMRVAELQRTAPELAAVVAQALSPEIQGQSMDQQDETNRRRGEHRARPSSGRRSRALW